MRSVCEGFLRSFGHSVDCVSNAEAAVRQLGQLTYDLVVADYKLPGMDGLQLLQQIKERTPETEVIIMTAYADIESAAKAVRLDAFDYLPKPFELEEMQRAVSKLERIKSLTMENIQLRRQLKQEYGIDRIIGESEAMAKVREIVGRVSLETATVLIEGENGTGKELVGKAIHYNGPRASGPFVPVDCAAIPPDQFAAELFGHAREPRTGVNRHKAGLLKLAEGGTVFLDEVADVPAEMQVKLLRSLQERSIRPVGSVDEFRVDVRVIAATTRSLEDCVQAQQFSQELYYQLNVVNISVPPLRERVEDIRPLIAHFLKARSTGSRRIEGISEDALEAVMSYRWPGNVRELENLVERAVALGLSDRIEKEDLTTAVLRASSAPDAALIASEDKLKPLEEIEREAILRTLERTGGDKMLASQILGIDRSTLYRKLKRF